MDKPRNRGTSAALLSLEDRAASARGSPWPMIMFIGCALMMAATVLLFG